MKPDLSIVIVSFNTRQLLKECLDSVYASLAESTLVSKVIVVDNYGGRTESPPRKTKGWRATDMLRDDWGGSYKAISGPNSVLSLLFARTDGDGDGIPDLLQ